MKLLLKTPPEEVPTKDKSHFRRYVADGAIGASDKSAVDDKQLAIDKRVRELYNRSHTEQTVEAVQKKHAKWLKFDHYELTIFQALDRLDRLIDESDPDLDLPNSVHAYQTAERARRAYPDVDWLHLVGLIHDVGKLLACPTPDGSDDDADVEPQWFTVGDTFPVGCAFDDAIVFGRDSFRNNPDHYDERYNTKFGIYAAACGLDAVTFSWGHDEYLYRVLRNHAACRLPAVALDIIRLHSFYPWHTDNAYGHLCDWQRDADTLAWVRRFNEFDLYSKEATIPDIPTIRPYYQSLVDKYLPGTIKW